MLQPLLVRPLAGAKEKYEVVCGNRRLLALRQNGAERCAAIIRELSDDEAADAQQVENLQREDLPPLEEGEALAALVAKHGLDSVAARTGKTAAFIRRRMMLTRLTGRARKLLQSGTLPIKAAELIAAVEEEAIRKKLCDGIGENGATPGGIADYLQREVLLKLNAAPFNKTKVYGCPNEDGRTCADCPFNTGVSKGQLFPELAQEARCLNGQCFHAKPDAEFELKAKAHAAKGGGVLGEKDAKRCWPYGQFDPSAFVPLESIRKLAQTAKVEIAPKDILIVRHPQTKEAHFVVPRPVAERIVETGQPRPTPGKHRADDANRQELRKQRVEAEKRKALRIAYTKALGSFTTIDAKLYPAIVSALTGKLNCEQWRVLFAARGVQKPKGLTWEQDRRFEKKCVAGLAKGQLAGFVLQCVALLADSYCADAEYTRAIAAAAGINGKKIEEAITAAINQRFTASKPQPKSAAANSARSPKPESSKLSVAARAA